MTRYRACFGIAVCWGVLSVLAGCGYHDHGYYPPGPPPSGDGAAPTGLIQGTDGNFYGTTNYGGRYGAGTFFKVTPAGVETLLYSFVGGPGDGAAPDGVIQGADGNFYGATSNGGSGPCPFGCGTVFKITPDGAETVLYFFSGAADGGSPNGLIQGSDGNFYGTTAFGGQFNSFCGQQGCGVVFRVTPAGGEAALYSFVGGQNDGALAASVIQGKDGNFYGTTQYGGQSNDGTVFKVTPAGVESLLHSFAGGNDGALPQLPLTQGSDGNLYGTTPYGGKYTNGVVFRVTPAGAATVLYAFAGTTSDGANPFTAMVQGSDGNFYGTASSGGDSACAGGCGTVFKMTPAGAESTLYLFTASAGTGAQPPGPSGLIQGSDGNFYGTTSAGGQFGAGTLFKLTPAGAETVLYSFGATP
ncbi:MAG TPA: choice-of-anchor tandem repeat GloVer-containing protein [Steroidobacteraceae bacterium]|nr:choice-of-anchor tandem repeat GloVer-containing protein [Steroidobacteraceae bacterium]